MSRDAHAPPYSTIVFDCDSTLSRIEGIEELAGPHRAAIQRVTERAMNGEIPLESVYAERLALVRPDRHALARLAERYAETLLPNVSELCAALRALDKRVCILSGGIAQAVIPLAQRLGLAPEDVFAVPVRLSADGVYLGYDDRSPLSRSGGKHGVVEHLAAEDAGAGLVLVGDGITDLEAKPACARFVAFGGVVRRPPVFAGADAACERPDFAALLPLLCSPQEIERLADLPTHLPLVRRARELQA